MRIAIPTSGRSGLNDTVGYHFGRVPTYTIVDTVTGEVEVLENTSEHRGGEGTPPDLLKRAGVDTLLVSGLGIKAVSLLSKVGIRTYVGAEGTVREALDQFSHGMLKPATPDDACAEHGH